MENSRIILIRVDCFGKFLAETIKAGFLAGRFIPIPTTQMSLFLYSCDNAFPAINKKPVKKTKSSYQPSFGIVETDAAYVIELDLPGIKKEDIAVDVNPQEQTLNVRAERKQTKYAESEEQQQKKAEQVYEERVFGIAERTFNLPKDADQDQINAQFENGVLILTVSKKAAAAKRQISIA